VGWPFSFRGEIGRVAYAFGALIAFFSQHLAALILFDIRGQPPVIDGQFWLIPLRSPFLGSYFFDQTDFWLPFFALPLTMITAWALASLSFRRAVNANIDPWIAAASVVPVLQLLAIIVLCLVPARQLAVGESSASNTAYDRSRWLVAIQGMLAGGSVTVFLVAVWALVFRSYGYGIFVFSPLMIGAMTGYFASRREELRAGPLVGLALGATALGGVALMVVALEGVVCLILAAPLSLLLALLGAMLGAEIARSRRTASFSFMSVALLPMAFGAERALPPIAHFDSYQAIEIAASPELVWQSIVEMEPIDSPPPLLFRLGVSYPVGGQFTGTGIGAMRRGEFSTGVAIERVTEWVANERLGLEVLSNPPAMRELSPYKHVYAPHVSGYFETRSMTFEIEQRGDRTLLVERTSHQLKLDPLWYWLPMAKWMVQQNNARVLAHIKKQAEQATLSEKL
jgi:hypothetical protein